MEEQLKEFGLSPKESRVFLTLLELGTSYVQRIAKESKLNRSTTYVILEKLLALDLVQETEDNKGKIYTPISPDQLLNKIDLKIKNFSEMENDFKSIVPDLESLINESTKKPKVLLFEGKEGLKSLYENMFYQKNDDTVRSFSFPETWKKIQSEFFSQTTKNIKCDARVISIGTALEADAVKKEIKFVNIDFALISTSAKLFSSDIQIKGNKVALLTADEFGIILEDKDIADTMKELFDLAWEEAKRIDAELRSGQKTEVKPKKVEKKSKK